MMQPKPARPSDPIVITKKSLLVVEGKDEQLFFEALCRDLEIVDLQILPVGGKSKIKDSILLLKVSPGFNTVVSLSIIRDADDSASDAFRSVTYALKDADLPAPEYPDSFVGGPPRVGIHILPGQDQEGALEDLCIRSIEDMPSYQCVTLFFKCITDRGLQPPQEPSKAKIQTYLASLPELRNALGLAAQAGYFTLNAAPYEKLRQFLREAIS
jgi:hypothetical protein